MTEYKVKVTLAQLAKVLKVRNMLAWGEISRKEVDRAVRERTFSRISDDEVFRRYVIGKGVSNRQFANRIAWEVCKRPPVVEFDCVVHEGYREQRPSLDLACCPFEMLAAAYRREPWIMLKVYTEEEHKLLNTLFPRSVGGGRE